MPSPLYLTFDDGPDPEWTPRVLEALERHGAQATFFVLGWRVRRHPDLIEDILAGGHRIELHGDEHLDHTASTTEELVDDTEDVLDSLRELGLIPQWWRIPFGQPAPVTHELAKDYGLRIVSWDVDPHDWRGDRWQDQPSSVWEAGGGVVLLHDAIVPGIGRTDAENTIEIADAMLTAARRAGVPALALPEATSPDRFPEAPPLALFGRRPDVTQPRPEPA